MKWLLEQSVNTKMVNAEGYLPTAEEQTRYDARSTASRLLSVAGANADIKVEGVLTQKPDFLAWLFGGGNTTYNDIIKALGEANADPQVSNVTLQINSPGGEFDGLFELLDAIQASPKRVETMGTSLVASAAFAIGSVTSRFTVVNRATRVGSVGVVAVIQTSDDEVTITSTNAPRKRPDVRTKQGVKMVQDEIDALHDIFVEAIADGRNVSVSDVNKNFGQGAVLLAGEAKKRGMIDAISQSGSQPVSVAAVGATTIQESPLTMDITTLKTQHPGVYNEAMAAGVDKERDRVKAHVTWGVSSGDMTTMCKALNEGTELTSSILATYGVATINKQAIDARQADSDESTAGDGAIKIDTLAKVIPKADKEAEDVTDMALDLLGVSI